MYRNYVAPAWHWEEGGFDVTPYPSAVAVVDINADGLDDAASILHDTPPPDDNQLYIQPQHPNGELGPALVLHLASDVAPGAGNILALTSGDLNGDGAADLVVMRSHGLELVYSTHGTPTAQPIKPLEPGLWYEATPMVFDFDHDGHMDIVTHTGMEQYDTIPDDPRSKVRVYFGDGVGNFPREAEITTGALTRWDLMRALHVDHGDFNGDGFDDIAISFWHFDFGAQGSTYPVKIFLNDGMGGLKAPYNLVDDDFALKDMAAADFTGDGRTDLVIVHNQNMSEDNTLRVYPQTPAGQLAPWSYSVLTYFEGTSLTTADLDNNGTSDLMVAHDAQLRVSYYLQSDGKLGDATYIPAGGNSSARYGPSSIAIGDLNHDGCKDALVAATYGGLWLMRGSNCTQ